MTNPNTPEFDYVYDLARQHFRADADSILADFFYQAQMEEQDEDDTEDNLEDLVWNFDIHGFNPAVHPDINSDVPPLVEAFKALLRDSTIASLSDEDFYHAATMGVTDGIQEVLKIGFKEFTRSYDSEAAIKATGKAIAFLGGGLIPVDYTINDSNGHLVPRANPSVGDEEGYESPSPGSAVFTTTRPLSYEIIRGDQASITYSGHGHDFHRELVDHYDFLARELEDESTQVSITLMDQGKHAGTVTGPDFLAQFIRLRDALVANGYSPTSSSASALSVLAGYSPENECTIEFKVEGAEDSTKKVCKLADLLDAFNSTAAGLSNATEVLVHVNKFLVIKGTADQIQQELEHYANNSK